MPAPVGHDDFIIRPPVFRERQEIPFEGIFRGFAAFAPDDYPGGTRRGGSRMFLRIRIVQGNLLSITGQPIQHPRLQISVRQAVACRRADPVDRQHERPVRGQWPRCSPTNAFRFSSPLRLTGTSVRTRGGFITARITSRCAGIVSSRTHLGMKGAPCRLRLLFGKNEIECDSNRGFREL